MILHMQRKKLNQSGMVSIIVTMIMMVIMSLVILGFARVSRREMRQGLDRQLASQANYAAETGIDDAQSYLAGGGGLSASAGTQCNTYAAGGLPESETVGIDSVVTSCVLVSSISQDLVYDNVDTDSEVLALVKSSDGQNIPTLYIAWQGPNGQTFNDATCPGGGSPTMGGLSTIHVPLDQWECPVGSLRIDILRIDPGVASRASLDAATIGGVLPPWRLTNPWSGSLGKGGQVPGGCAAGATPRSCRVNLGLTSFSGVSNTFYVRIRPLYRAADIYIQAKDATGGPIPLTGAQTLIDSTGRANDVLKRLVVRVPTCPSGIACGKRPANTALQLADTLCKRYGVMPAPTSTINVESGDTACQLP